MDYDAKISIGFVYVTDMLNPSSGPGAKLLRALSPYTPLEKDALIKELDNVEKFSIAIDSFRSEVARLDGVLSRVKDISGSIDALGKRPLDETELFEIKTFCSVCSEAESALAALKIPDSGLCLHSLEKPRSLFGKGEGFYIDDCVSDSLRQARAMKKQVASAMKKATGKERKALEEQYSLFAAREYSITREILAELSENLYPYAQNLKDNLYTLGKTDLLLQKAKLTKKFAMTKPQIGKTLSFKGAVNPMTEAAEARRGGKFCPLDIDAESGVTIITGANMGGKTVALKTIALNTFLALSGFFVFARAATVPMFDGIEIAALDAQDHERGLSSFAADVLRLDGIYRSSLTGRKLILADEFASGTNAEEGAAIFRACVSAFGKTSNTVIMTTHFDNVSTAAAGRYQVKGLSELDEASLHVDRDEDGVSAVRRYMDYGLIPIPLDRPMPHDAIKICRLLGISEDILDKIK